MLFHKLNHGEIFFSSQSFIKATSHLKHLSVRKNGVSAWHCRMLRFRTPALIRDSQITFDLLLFLISVGPIKLVLFVSVIYVFESYLVFVQTLKLRKLVINLRL